MLNLRQFNMPDHFRTTSARNFSRFSVSFRVPSNFLGSIGEELDHSQYEWSHETDEKTAVPDAEENELNIINPENAEQVAALSGVHWGPESEAGADQQSGPPAAGPSGTRRDGKTEPSDGLFENVAGP